MRSALTLVAVTAILGATPGNAADEPVAHRGDATNQSGSSPRSAFAPL